MTGKFATDNAGYISGPLPSDPGHKARVLGYIATGDMDDANGWAEALRMSAPWLLDDAEVVGAIATRKAELMRNGARK